MARMALLRLYVVKKEGRGWCVGKGEEVCGCGVVLELDVVLAFPGFLWSMFG